MQRSFSHYYSMSKDLSKFAFKKLGFITKLELLVYITLSFLSKFVFFIRPIFAVADDNIGAMISETHSLCFQKAFEGVPEKYFKLMLTYFVEDLVTLAFFSILFWPLYILCLFAPDVLLFHIIATVILSIAVLIALGKRVKFTMIGFVAAYDNNLSMGDYFYNCRTATGKAAGNVIKNEILYFIIFHIFPTAVMTFSFRWLFRREFLYNVWDLYIGFGLFILAFFIYVIWLEKYALVKYTTDHLIAQDACIKKKCMVAKRIPSSKEEYAAVFAQNKADFEKLDITREGK